MLKKELEKIFSLNEMQEKAYQNQGKNLVFNAPTGSGKTEAVLLSIPQGKTVSFLLPTITSSIFMYRRLKETGFFNLDLKTSILKEIETVKNPILNIEIHTPDGPLLDYMKDKTQTLNDVVVMDELDNYPPMVKTVLIHYIKNNPQTQFIVASATLDNNLKEAFSDFEKIEYNTDIDLLKFKTEEFITSEYPDEDDYEIFANILNNVEKDGKIGFIFNCIDNMESFADTYSDIFYDDNGNLKEGIIMHHSNVDVDTRNENKKKLFNGDYKVCISNDIISYSVDINFDTMFMEPSDRTATNIQRMGRCNRYNQEIKDKTNLYILPDLYTPPFMDGWDKREECEKFAEQKEKKVIKKFHIKPIGDEIPYADFPVRPIINKDGEIEKLKKDIVLIQKRRVCNDFFIMLDNKVPVKTERIGAEKYKEIRMEETALNFSIKDLNNLKKITDTITEIYNEIEKKVNKFEIHPRKSDNLKFKIFEKFLNEIENKMKDDEIKKIHQYLENKLDNLIEGWENIPFEKTSNFTQIFNKMIYYDIIIPENKEKNSFLEKSNEYQKYIQKNDFKKILNNFIEETLINDFGEMPPRKNEKIKNIDKKINVR